MPLPQSVEPGRAGSIFIDREMQFSILQNKNSVYNDIIMPKDIPQTWSYLQVNFDTKEKLALYEYVIKNTECIAEPEITIEYVLLFKRIFEYKSSFFLGIKILKQVAKS